MKKNNTNTFSALNVLLLFIGFVFGGMMFSDEGKFNRIRHVNQIKSLKEQIALCEKEKEEYRIIVDDYIAIGLCDETCCKTSTN